MRLQLCFVILLLCASLQAQTEEKSSSSWELTYANGTILEHNPDIAGLIQGRNTSAVLRYNRHTDGTQEWEQRYGYPDWGFMLSFQDMGNPDLGQNIALYGHYTFYFFKRYLALTIGQGISYNTNPFDAETNFRNIAYGSHLLSATYLGLHYKKKIGKRLGVLLGVELNHYSNGNIKAPNTSTNSLSFGLGLSYDTGVERTYKKEILSRYTEPIRYNLTFSSGINQSDVIGSGQFPFYNFSVFADKRLSYKSTVQLGTELLISNFLREFIRFRSVAFPNDNLSGDEDNKRVGVFAGYELRLNRTAAFVNLGYYVYYPFDFEGRVYERIGLKRYFKNKIFGSVAVRAHVAKAEAVEFGLGIRL